MSDKFTESMEVEAVGNLKPGDIGWGTCDGCKKNIHKFPGVLIQGVTPDAAKLLYEKVEVVPVGTKAKMEEMAAANRNMSSQIKGLQKEVLEFFDSTNATVIAGRKICITYAHLKNRVTELEASNKEMLEALKDCCVIAKPGNPPCCCPVYHTGEHGGCSENEDGECNIWKAIHKARGLQQ